MALAKRKEYQNATVRLPRQVYERARRVVEKSETASSFNEFVVKAIEEKLLKARTTHFARTHFLTP